MAMQNPTKPMQKPQKVAALLFDDFSNHCLANAIEPLRAANGLAGRTLFEWQFLSIDGAPVSSSSGMDVTPKARLADHNGGDILLVMPSYRHHDHARPHNLSALRAAARRFDIVAGLDTGAWLMAAAGLLDGHRATIHWNEIRALEETFPDITVTEDRFVIDGSRITSGGASTSFELMLDLIKRQHGPMLALEVGALFMHGEADPVRDQTLRLPPDRIVQSAAALMRRNIETPLSLSTIAKRLNLSLRRFEELVKSATGRGPGALYRAIRLREARVLVTQSRFSIAEIAARVGYEDASAMTRAFGREFGISPSALRRDSDQARSAP